MQTSAWTLTRGTDGIATLVLDLQRRSANTLGTAVLQEFGTRLDELEADPPQGLILRSGKPSGFIAGADVNEFTGLASAEEALVMVQRGQELFQRLESLPCASVALLHGFALGGGLELALACTYRVGIDDGSLSLGLPEVQLGIHPGFGGTVRTVRLLGVRPAMDLMLTGRTLRADKALRAGLIDRLVPAAEAENACRTLLRTRPAPHRPPLTERALSWPGIRGLVYPALRRQVAARAREAHYPAPFALIDLWRRFGARGAAAYEAEAQSISHLFLTPTARNLVRVFQLQDRLKALGSRDRTGEVAPVRRVHVVGAGVMGGDIAAWCALRGLTVTLQDRSAELVAPAMARAGELFEKRTRNAEERAKATERLIADVGGEGVVNADLALEAIYENLEAKQQLYASLEPRQPPGALLATNTSSLRLEDLAQGLARPGSFVGLHFFNPVAQMPLVEVVHSSQTDPAALSRALSFVRRIDKLPLPCRSAPGFVVNRVLMPYLQEAMVALEQGIPAEVIDAAALDFGMPMGPLELADVVGLDVCKKVGEIVAGSLGRTPPVPLARIAALVAEGKLGRKKGEGFYVWRDGKPLRKPVTTAPPADLTDRLILVLVNECVACLREGIVADADLIDAGCIFGAGFAPFLGGPLAWARSVGVDATVSRLTALATSQGPRFTPDAGWSLLRT
jgi:3-hydroxyacyl-CoA dehydrogenase/enoyl-CoA hydratase/3-hydroxybutyryl-CoA epimerase